jgi:hypothetical protein
MINKSIRILIKKLLSLTGYKLSNLKYLYNYKLNLVTSLNYLKIKSVADVRANEGQFILKLLKMRFKENVLIFEPVMTVIKNY